MDFFNKLKVNYTAGNPFEWRGRQTEIENQYWYQAIATAHLKNVVLEAKKNTNFGLIGYVCDEGVERNQGRIDARKGPESLRNKLGKLPVHFQDKKVTDFGDIICLTNEMETCQKALSKAVCQLIKNNILPIAIGGGHDIAYANFNGIKKALKNTSDNSIGIINFDAHFDLRPVETKPNSGTPFYQILTENKNVSYLAIGIQEQSNTKELFDIAASKNVSYVSHLDCEMFDDTLKNKLSDFLEKIDHLYITIDLDGFSSAYAPGVSAPSPLGFSPNFAYRVLKFLFDSKKVVSCDIAELNPTFDSDNITANLAAKLVDFIVKCA